MITIPSRLKDLYRIVIHFPIGLAIGILSVRASFALALFLFITFILYELCEDWHLKDHAYKDIAGCLLGLMLYSAWVIFCIYLSVPAPV